MTPERLAAIKAGAETALDAVHRGWPWPEIDNDLVIGASLKDVPALVAEVERLRVLITRLAVSDERGWPYYPDDGDAFCFWCHAEGGYPHAADCPYRAALATLGRPLER